MRTLLAMFVAAGVLAVAAGPAFAQGEGSAKAQAPSLYKRLGGYDAIAAVTDAFVPRLVKDPMLSKYFVHSEDTLKHIRQMAVDFLCAATGGPCVYVGRDMKTAHKGLGITSAEWDAAVKHLAATLDQFKVPATEKQEFLTLAGTLKAEIVEK
jgi:hemoglobin